MAMVLDGRSERGQDEEPARWLALAGLPVTGFGGILRGNYVFSVDTSEEAMGIGLGPGSSTYAPKDMRETVRVRVSVPPLPPISAPKTRIPTFPPLADVASAVTAKSNSTTVVDVRCA
jgi:hypothetical protein